MKQAYKRQVSLLLNILPEVAREDCFVLHGGTAINLFVRNMPRMSVDIDLTYLPVEDRKSSMSNIVGALVKIDERIKKVFPNVNTQLQQELLKIQINRKGAQIKIEVNQINRGCVSRPEKLVLCERAQEMFDAYCTMAVVPRSQLFGGKIVAALDRQHPRDLFDIKYLLEEKDFNDEIRKGFIFSLLSSNRPIYELLNPNRTDQHKVFKNQIEGMTIEPFSYAEFEKTREELILIIHKILTKKDRDFLIGFKCLEPDWSIYNFKEFPAIQWKLENLRKYKVKNRKGYDETVRRLLDFLF